MSFNAKDCLTEIAGQEKKFDALYREAAVNFGLPDCSMWVLYFVISSEAPVTQQDLIEKMMFPKQTINSAVMKLAKEGLLELRIIPGTRNRKTILLTERGKDLAQKTVARMLNAELRAVEAMGTERMEQFVSLYTALSGAIRKEFVSEGLCHEE